MNEVIDALLGHWSVRKYQDKQVPDELIQTIVRAGQQAPFASQLYSVILSRKGPHPFGAPLLFTICVDFHKMSLIMRKRGWQQRSNDLDVLIMGIQDASYMVQNMIVAAESLGIGSCLLGTAPHRADKIKQQYDLPPKVFPMVQLVMGYPAEERRPRPRYPMDFVLFEDKYPQLDDARVERAMKVMDEGYLAQDYYRRANAKIKIVIDKEDNYTYDNYSWTEHISRKWGQWNESSNEILDMLALCGFSFEREE